MNNNKKVKAVNYRILNADVSQITAILSKLFNPTKTERAFNAVPIHQHGETIRALMGLDPKQFAQLCEDCRDAVSFTVDLDKVQGYLDGINCRRQRLIEQTEKAEWLIEHNASNKLIMDVCTSLDGYDIKRLRNRLNRPAQLGRQHLPDLNTRTFIVRRWLEIRGQHADEFKRYRVLQEQFAQYNLSQLYTIVTDSDC